MGGRREHAQAERACAGGEGIRVSGFENSWDAHPLVDFLPTTDLGCELLCEVRWIKQKSIIQAARTEGGGTGIRVCE